MSRCAVLLKTAGSAGAMRGMRLRALKALANIAVTLAVDSPPPTEPANSCRVHLPAPAGSLEFARLRWQGNGMVVCDPAVLARSGPQIMRQLNMLVSVHTSQQLLQDSFERNASNRTPYMAHCSQLKAIGGGVQAGERASPPRASLPALYAEPLLLPAVMECMMDDGESDPKLNLEVVPRLALRLLGALPSLSRLALAVRPCAGIPRVVTMASIALAWRWVLCDLLYRRVYVHSLPASPSL